MEELSFLLFTSLNNKISSYLNKKEGAHLRWCAIYEHIFRQFYAIVKNQIGLLRKTVKKKLISLKGGGVILSIFYRIVIKYWTDDLLDTRLCHVYLYFCY